VSLDSVRGKEKKTTYTADNLSHGRKKGCPHRLNSDDLGFKFIMTHMQTGMLSSANAAKRWYLPLARKDHIRDLGLRHFHSLSVDQIREKKRK
jgi:hypothetical protein